MTKEEKLNYDDITIIPEVLTDIDSRKQCNPYDKEGFLPIFASPMTSVVSRENAEAFNDAKIKCVIPRSCSIEDRLTYLFSHSLNFVAFSLQEAAELFTTEDGKIELYQKYWPKDENGEPISGSYPLRICIDLANGHMKKLLNTVKTIKSVWKENVIIMSGNIANPKSYIEYEKAGCEYVRVGIGGGSLCLTTSSTAVGMPYFSLIKEIYEIKKEIGGKCKIIADGNIRNYGDIQKALIYADYVMIGGIFNKAIESAGKTTYGKSYFNVRGFKFLNPLKTLFTYGKEIQKKDYDKVMKLIKANKLTVWKEEFGQSTKQAQAAVNNANGVTGGKLKTAEGIVKYQKVEYTIDGWSENETDYLRSAMSYTNSKTLEDYKDSEWVRITKRRYND